MDLPIEKAVLPSLWSIVEAAIETTGTPEGGSRLQFSAVQRLAGFRCRRSGELGRSGMARRASAGSN